MDPDAAPVRMVTVGDAQLYVEDDPAATAGRAGEERPALVFAHGGTGSHQHWWQQVPVFRARHRCVTFDARGFGRSTGAAHVRGIDGHAEDLLAVLDALGIGRAVLVGHSMGGYAVSGVARHHPARVAGLVMVDTPFGFATAALGRWAAAMMDRLVAGFDVTAACTAPGFAAARPDLAFLLDSIVRGNPPRPPARGLGAYEQMRDAPPDDLTGYAVPTLFVVGEHDALTVPSLLAATAAAVPGASLVTIAGAGHSPHFEQAEAFNAALGAFLEALGSPGA
jgi:3-oxoadipate enol-lactonase